MGNISPERLNLNLCTVWKTVYKKKEHPDDSACTETEQQHCNQ